MKTLTMCALVLCAFFFTSCDEFSSNDQGYEDAWDDKKPGLFSSSSYKRGFEQGQADSDMQDTGFYDGYNGNHCAFPNDFFYMDGFKLGKKESKKW